MTKEINDFDDTNVVPSNWISWNVPIEDKIFGTLISKKQMKSTLPGKEDEMTNVYEMKADYGSFHQVDEKKKVIDEPVLIAEDEIYNIGGKSIIDRQMQNIKIGQKIGLKFIEELPSKTKGFNPAKIVKVFAPKNDDGTPKMDEVFLEERNNLDHEFDAA